MDTNQRFVLISLKIDFFFFTFFFLKHYHESDEYAIRSTNDPYHHPMDNKTDGLPGGGEPLRHMAPYNMPQMHPYPNQPPYPHQPGPGPHMNQK